MHWACIWEMQIQMGRPKLSKQPGVSRTFPKLWRRWRRKISKRGNTEASGFHLSSKSVGDTGTHFTCNEDHMVKQYTSEAERIYWLFLPGMAVDQWSYSFLFPFEIHHWRTVSSRIPYRRASLWSCAFKCLRFALVREVRWHLYIAGLWKGNLCIL